MKKTGFLWTPSCLPPLGHPCSDWGSHRRETQHGVWALPSPGAELGGGTRLRLEDRADVGLAVQRLSLRPYPRACLPLTLLARLHLGALWHPCGVLYAAAGHTGSAQYLLWVLRQGTASCGRVSMSLPVSEPVSLLIGGFVELAALDQPWNSLTPGRSLAFVNAEARSPQSCLLLQQPWRGALTLTVEGYGGEPGWLSPLSV